MSEAYGARVNPTWWHRPDLQDALASRDIAAVFHFLRGRGFSQTRIATLTGQSQSEVSAILTHGRLVTAYNVLARIADGLDIPHGLMGMAYLAPVAVIQDETDATEGRHVRRRTFMGVAAKIAMGATLAPAELAILTTPAAAAPIPQRIGMTDVQHIVDMCIGLGNQDLAFGGGACREAIVGYLNWATGLRHATMTDDVRRALDTALARLESLAGWVSYDLLLLDSAEQFFLRALHSARLADDPRQASRSLSRLGKIYVQERKYGEAMRMFQLATVPAREAGSHRLAAYLHLHDAIIHARQGRPRETEDAINRGLDEYSRAEADPPAWLARFLNDAELHHHTALAYADLACHDPAMAPRAVEAAAEAARHSNPAETRALLLVKTNLALNAYRAGDTTLANETTGSILAALPQVNSRRLTTRLRPLATEAATHDSTATDLAHRLHAVVSA